MQEYNIAMYHIYVYVCVCVYINILFNTRMTWKDGLRA